MYKVVKRVMDILFSTIALILLLPLFIPIVLLLFLTGEGEIFYKQERVGFQNKIFEIWKFATMVKNSPNLGTGDVTLRNDPRVTSVGKYLRMTKLNELPQIINIIIGDMSIVGPRPLMKAGFDRYDEEYRNNIYNVPPGLTGMGSIAFRDEENIMTNSSLPPKECYAKIILPHKGALEIWYQKNISFWTDIKIIVGTAWVIIFPKSDLIQEWFSNVPQRKKSYE